MSKCETILFALDLMTLKFNSLKLNAETGGLDTLIPSGWKRCFKVWFSGILNAIKTFISSWPVNLKGKKKQCWKLHRSFSFKRRETPDSSTPWRCCSTKPRLIAPLFSARGAGPGEIRQVMWHVVAGGHHVHPVSFHPFAPLDYVWLCFLLCTLNQCDVSTAHVSPTGCVDTLLSTPTTAWPSLLAWRGGSGWGNTSFPTLSGRTCRRKVRLWLSTKN